MSGDSSRWSSTSVSNAVKFTPDGGSVSITACREGTALDVTVTDTGIGVPPEDQERIFESFQQGGRGASKEEGTGLGLTLSRRIVTLMGGRMWLKSTPKSEARSASRSPACRSHGTRWRRRGMAIFPWSSSSTMTGRRWTSSAPTSTVHRYRHCGPGTASRVSS